MGGKTVLASQFPQPFFVDLEDGLHSVKALRSKLGLDFNFDVITIDENPTTDEDFIKLCGQRFSKMSGWSKTRQLVEVLCRKMPKNTTLVFDNISRAYEMLLTHIQGVVGRSKLQIQDWGTFVDEMGAVINVMKYKAKCNIIIIGHEEYIKDELSGELYRKFLMVTKLRERLPSMVSEFWRLYSEPKGPKNKREIVRRLQTESDFTTAVGSRSLVPNMENPTYAKLKPYLEKLVNDKLPEPTWTPPDKL